MATKYMMATKANHLLGDISRDVPDLCLVSDEGGDSYIGNWVEGLGFFNVEFPKATTRELTPEEIEKYHGRRLGGCMHGTLDVKGNV
jgi:hypothetical protein